MKRTAIILFALICSMSCAQNPQLSKTDVAQLQKLGKAMYLITTGYVDTIDTEKVVNAAISKALSELDPHSVFISKDELTQDNELFEGNFEGIGIEFNVLNDTLIVVNTIAGGPSAAVGLLPGDRIIEVNGKSTIGIKQTGVPKVLRGAKGTIVDAKIIRRGVREPMMFKIIRDKIPMNSLDAAYMIAPEVGYIKLNRFSATTNSELKEGIAKLEGAKKMILDLRGNGGGYYGQSIEVVSNFIEPGKLVVYTDGRAVPRSDAFSSGEPIFGTGELVVLVDQNSASSSEIVAGALQDWDRATIVGRRTFGKGLVQSQIPLDDGSAMRLTIAHYYTPSGRSIQRPYKLGDKQDYYMDIVERYNSGEITSDKAVVDSSLVYKTKVKGRTVYGGGGILPDVIVPLDTTSYTQYWGELIRSGLFLEFTVSDLDKNRASYLKLYPTFEEFDSKFIVDDKVVDQFLALAEKRGIKRNEQQLKISRTEIESYIKALLAGRLYQDGDFYKVINRHDKREIAAALKILEN